MVETIATVKHWQQGVVLLRASQQSSCSACGQKDDCGTQSLTQALSRHQHELELPWPEPLTAGTQVVVAMPESGLLKACAMMFLLPLFLLISTAVLAQSVLVEQMQMSELILVPVVITAAVSGFWGCRRWYRSVQASDQQEPRIIRVLGASLTVQSH